MFPVTDTLNNDSLHRLNIRPQAVVEWIMLNLYQGLTSNFPGYSFMNHFFPLLSDVQNSESFYQFSKQKPSLPYCQSCLSPYC